MNSLPYLYISSNGLQGPNGWSASWDPSGGLPSVPKIMETLDPDVFGSDKLGVLLSDDLLHPLRIELEDKVSAAELSQYLLWKLKRFLPMPVEQAVMRHVPLNQANVFMTFSLQKTWLNDLYDAMSARGPQCGYMGGLFLTLLENQSLFRNRTLVGLFQDFYMLAVLDGKGEYTDFRTRRLPFDANGDLDASTLARGDLASMTTETQTVTLLNFEPSLDRATDPVLQGLTAGGLQANAPRLEGSNILERFEYCMHAKAGL